MKAHFVQMARYNAWANLRLYRMAAALPEEAYHREIGAFFRSLHGILNHLLASDRIWMRRLTGSGEHPARLDGIVGDTLAALTTARRLEDARICAYVEALDADALAAPLAYQTLAGAPHSQPLREILAHLFNHQTHHRGQAHAALTTLGVAEPEPLDLLIMQRELGWTAASHAPS